MIGVVGVNRGSAPLPIRERLVFSEGEVSELIQALRRERPHGEFVLLSTCHRTELYYNVGEPDRDTGEALFRRVTSFKGLDKEMTPYVYARYGEEAVTHVLRVAAGLDSMVVGENQILGQVREAYRTGAWLSCTGPVLNRLFHRALELGKRVRSETAINRGASSLGYAAAELAAGIFHDPSSHAVLLVGAGGTAELVVHSLFERGVTDVRVANRTLWRAQKLAERYCARPVSLGDVPEQLTQCDIVLTSTESPIPLISLESVREAMRRRTDRNLFFIDLSVPRDVEEGVDRIAGVHLYELDDLEQVVSRNSQARRGEVSKAEELVAAYAADYWAWMRSQELSPTIHGLKQQLGAITSKKLNAMKKDLDEKEMRHAEDLAHQLERSFLALIIRNLKQLSENGEKPDCLDTVNRLFGIEIDRPKPQVRDEP